MDCSAQTDRPASWVRVRIRFADKPASCGPHEVEWEHYLGVIGCWVAGCTGSPRASRREPELPTSFALHKPSGCNIPGDRPADSPVDSPVAICPPFTVVLVGLPLNPSCKVVMFERGLF